MVIIYFSSKQAKLFEFEMVGYLVVDVELVVDGDPEAGAVEDVQRFGEERKFESGSRGQEDAATTGLSNSVLSSLKIRTTLKVQS